MARLRGRGYIPKEEQEARDDSTAKAIQGINFATQTAMNIVEGVNKANEAKLLERGYTDSSNYKVSMDTITPEGNPTTTEVPVFERGGSGKIGARPINRVRMSKFGRNHFTELAGNTEGSSFNHELTKFMKDNGAPDSDIVDLLNRNIPEGKELYNVDSMNTEFKNTLRTIETTAPSEEAVMSEINLNSQNLNMDKVQYNAMATNDMGLPSGVEVMDPTDLGITDELTKTMYDPPMTGQMLDPSMAATDALTGETLNVATGETLGQGVATGVEGQIVDATGQMVTEELAQKGLETGVEKGIQTGIEQTVVEELGKETLKKTTEKVVTDASLQAGLETAATTGASTAATAAMAAVPIVGWTMFAINMLNTAKKLKDAKDLEEDMEYEQSLMA
tara:strand:- start:23 stop:1195 length:1173 start_codon:yes stop_codon:yes gene_type:complete